MFDKSADARLIFTVPQDVAARVQVDARGTRDINEENALNSERKVSLVEQARSDKAEEELLADTLNESTGLTWLWSILFGPLYFWVNGFVLIGFALLAVCIVTIGFGVLIAPFLAYPAWRARAKKKAGNLAAISRAREGRVFQ